MLWTQARINSNGDNYLHDDTSMSFSKRAYIPHQIWVTCSADFHEPHQKFARKRLLDLRMEKVYVSDRIGIYLDRLYRKRKNGHFHASRSYSTVLARTYTLPRLQESTNHITHIDNRRYIPSNEKRGQPVHSTFVPRPPSWEYLITRGYGMTIRLSKKTWNHQRPCSD